jgi:hypothetical protein
MEIPMKFSNPILARIEVEFPDLARDLKKVQADEGMTEEELVASLKRCVDAVLREVIKTIIVIV